MNKRLSFSVFVCITLAVLTLAQTNASTDKQIRDTEIARIKAYCQELDDYAKRNPKFVRLFADVSSGMKGEKSRWREFNPKSVRNMNYIGSLMGSAIAWSKDGAVALVSCAFQSPSGDWRHLVSYYFREDGSLAKIHARLNTFYGDMTVFREQFYDQKGRLLSSSKQFLDLETQKEKKPGTEFEDETIPLYRTVKALPFYTLLSKPAAKTK